MEDPKEPRAAPARAAAPETVKLRHPHTQDTVEVDATAAALVPYMVQGYEQVQPGRPA
jgi:hypothetical protein